MDGLLQLWDVLLITCGWPCVVVMLLLSVLNLGSAIYLVQSGRRLVMADYVPLTWLPFCVGAFRSLLSLVTAVGLLRSSVESNEGALLLGLALVPLLFGFALSLPAFITVVAGKATLTWRATKPLSVDQAKLDAERATTARSLRESAETDRYLSSLTRSRD